MSHPANTAPTPAQTARKPPGRPPARMAEPIDTSTSHLGFRLIVRTTRTDQA